MCNRYDFFSVQNGIPSTSTNDEDLILDDDPPDPRIIQTIDDLCSAFMIAPQSSTKKHLPSYTTRADVNTWTDENSKSAKRARKGVVNFYLVVLRYVSEILFGHDAAHKSLCELAKTLTKNDDTVPCNGGQTKSLI